MSEITLTLKEANTLYPALVELADIPMRGKTAFRIGKFLLAVKNELVTYEAARMKVVERMGVLKEPEAGAENPNGSTQWQISKDNIATYNEEIEEMMAETFTLKSKKIDAATLEKIDIKPSVIAELEPLIDGLE